MKKFIAILFAVISLSLVASVIPLYSQQPIPVGPGDGDSHTTPLGGMAVLAALGGGYAIKKLRDRSNE